ncbi:MAG: hypothetical protein J5I93_03210 [Pirellulaceae bacterium]|nr:hypothetical protein [Pirellulaceae bacterium]
MTRSLLLLGLLCLLATTGCAMCGAPDDLAYSAYGGVWQRDDMYRGRVGSILDPTGGPYLAATAAEENGMMIEPIVAPEAEPPSEPPSPPADGPAESPPDLLPPDESLETPRPLSPAPGT